jgi:hypothetical protein
MNDYQKGEPGSMVKTSAITMKASPVPWAAWQKNKSMCKIVPHTGLYIKILRIRNLQKMERS